MAKYITGSGSTTVAAAADGVFIQVNAALTGTITLAVGGTTFAVITNPTVGSQYKYGGLHGQGALTVNPSTTCDITVSIINRVF